MSKVVYLISGTFILLSYSFTSVAGSIYYRCTDGKGHITLQDSACPEESFQHVLPMPTFSYSNTDALRPNELASLERLHELTALRKTYEYENNNALALARVQHKNIMDYENLRHQHAIEMFDKNYRHFWINGYSIGEAPLSFAESYYRETTQSATGNNNNQANNN